MMWDLVITTSGPCSDVVMLYCAYYSCKKPFSVGWGSTWCATAHTISTVVVPMVPAGAV